MSREHGSRARYVHGPDAAGVPGTGCRCGACTAANRDWAANRARMKLYGRWAPYVDASPAREHVLMLQAAGIGRRRIAELAGLPLSTITELLYRRGGRPRSQRLRAQTGAAILAVQSSPADGALVEATATRRRLQALVAAGWPKAQLAPLMGMSPGNLGVVMGRAHVIAATERTAAALYDELWDRRPPETSHREKISASGARNYARARGWALPLAWDDDTIADPAALPAAARAHDGPPRGRELAAGAVELFQFGLDRRQAAERLGVSKNTLEKALARYRREAA